MIEASWDPEPLIKWLKEEIERLKAKLAAWERPCEDVESVVIEAAALAHETWRPQNVVPATVARRLAAQLRSETEARNALEGDRTELQAKVGHLEQQLADLSMRLCSLENDNNKLREQLAAKSPERPRIVCLCGSTRFKDEFMDANYRETMAGNIVLSVGFYMHAENNTHGQHIGATPEQKVALDELHKRKIDLCDEVYVLDVNGYIGSSTRSEIDYAVAHDKPVRYLSNELALAGVKVTK